MNYPGFLKIENRNPSPSNVIVAHSCPPPFAMEVDVEVGKDGRRRKGAIRRLSLPNSCLGNYHSYAPLIAKGERFLEEALIAEDDGTGLPLPAFAR